MSALTQPVGEEDALSRARLGDQDAFGELVARHESMVFSIALRVVADRARAEEIAQEVFLQFYRSLGTIESESHALFWLRQVTSRRCVDELRRRPRLQAVAELREIGTEASWPDPIRDRTLQRLVAELPEAQRVVLTLRYQEDLDPSEICRIVGMPVNTVKSHLQRALQSLRRKLGDQ